MYWSSFEVARTAVVPGLPTQPRSSQAREPTVMD